MSGDIAGLIALFLNILTFAIIGRALISWFDPGMRTPVGRLLHQITEPIIAPIRQVVPSMGMFDLSPIIALLVLQLVGRLISQALA